MKILNNELTVSVWMTTYFHEEYIRQALDSILTQETNYRYEIVIGDDCSKDRTRDILLEYQKRYPNIIRLLLNEHNLGITTNIYNVKCNCQGKYIVNLSGDDYWIDQKKIQKQVDFLENHTEYIAACCVVEIRRDFDEVCYDSYPAKKSRGKEFTLQQFARGELMPAHGMMMRNVFLNEKDKERFSIMKTFSRNIDDLADPVLILESGKVFIMDEPMTVYRVVTQKKDKNNFNSRFDMNQKLEQIIDMNNAVDHYLKGTIDISRRYDKYVAYGLFDAILKRQLMKFLTIYRKIPVKYRKKGMMLRVLLKCPGYCIKRLYTRKIKSCIAQTKNKIKECRI